jgi:peptidoglycan L-alanyl-D-glutamate endopeptidase CwlK
VSSRVEDLLPEVADAYRSFAIAAGAAGIPLFLVHTLRTWPEQDLLYAKGRTRPGEPCWHPDGRRPVGTCPQHPLGVPVTRARAGFSWHNFGRAFDVAILSDIQTPMWPKVDDPRWAQLGTIGKAIGLEWGGSWKPPDPGHFQMREGLTLAAARSGYVLPGQAHLA